VGRNFATTFEGFCSNHDAILFRPIETQIFDLANDEQLFLYAYRAIVRELHASMEAAIKLQFGYQGRVEAGLDTGTEPEEAGLRAVDQMLVAHSTFEYKVELDRALTAARHDALIHKIVQLDDQAPVLAVSALFDLNNRPNDEEPPRIALNVFPISDKQTVVVFSFTHRDAPAVKDYLHDVLRASGAYQKYLISRMVLMHAENFIVAPSLFDTWSPEKKGQNTSVLSSNPPIR
jgi:hypothetical protein